MRKFLFAGGYLDDALHSRDLARGSPDFYATIGIHPCRATEPFKEDGAMGKEEKLEKYLKKIEEELDRDRNEDKKYVAVGECGLDYDRFEYADKYT